MVRVQVDLALPEGGLLRTTAVQHCNAVMVEEGGGSSARQVVGTAVSRRAQASPSGGAALQCYPSTHPKKFSGEGGGGMRGGRGHVR